jgi:hypothetical protein
MAASSEKVKYLPDYMAPLQKTVILTLKLYLRLIKLTVNCYDNYEIINRPTV